MFFDNTLKNIYNFEDAVSEINHELNQQIISGNYNGIEINSEFNSQIDNLPNSIKYISWSKNSKFNNKINKYPNQLEELYMYNCNEFILKKFIIPKTLKILQLPQYYSGCKINFEQGLKEIIIMLSKYKYHLDNLPESLESLYIYCHAQTNITNDNFIIDIVIPKHIKVLKIISDYIKFNVGLLPENLEILVLESFGNYNINTKNIDTKNIIWSGLPNKLVELHINLCYFDESLNNLPQGLQKLYIYSDKFNNSIDMLPDSLKILHIISKLFNKSISDLPIGLEELKIVSKSSFNQSLSNISQGIKILYLNIQNCKFILENIPKKLTTLNCTGNELICEYFVFNSICKIHSTFTKLIIKDINLPIIYFPDKLKYLFLSIRLVNELPILPNNLEVFILNNDNYNKSINFIPLTLKMFKLHSSIFTSPLELTNTNIEYLDLKIKSITSIVNLPTNLKYFHIKCTNFSEDDLINFELNQISNLYINCPNLIYFGFEIINFDSINYNFGSFIDKIFNSLPDSINFIFYYCNIYRLNLIKVPKNLKEICYTNDYYEYNGIEYHKLIETHYKSIKKHYKNKFKISNHKKYSYSDKNYKHLIKINKIYDIGEL